MKKKQKPLLLTNEVVEPTKFEWMKKNIVIIPVIAAIVAGSFTSIRYVLNLTDTINANQQDISGMQRDVGVVKDNIANLKNRLAAAEATWNMAENLYRQLADQVREHSYDIKDLSR
jgi:septal ring factor EnvC (AmiA/AmiB activator)|tara:strand:- start:231 stop:578 length:348 start_codon:yes stop_codon:yes gene_type:complete